MSRELHDGSLRVTIYRMRPETNQQNTDSGLDLVRVYFDAAKRYPLLTKVEEVRLSEAVWAGRAATAALVSLAQMDETERRPGEMDASPPIVSAALDESRLSMLRKTKRDGEDAKELFIKSNLRLVISIATRMKSGLLLDRIQEGNIGLIEAVENYDHRRGFRFSTYATRVIYGTIARESMNKEGVIRIPAHMYGLLSRYYRVKEYLEGELCRTPTAKELAATLELTDEQFAQLRTAAERSAKNTLSLDAVRSAEVDLEFHDLISDENDPSPEAVALQQVANEAIEAVLAELNSREREIIHQRFGYTTGGETFAEIGRKMGLSRGQTTNIYYRALEKLRYLLG